MRLSKFVSACGVLALLLTACVNNILPGSNQNQSGSAASPTPPAASAASPVAPGTVPAAGIQPPAAPVAPGGGYQTQATLNGVGMNAASVPVTVIVNGLQRTGNTLTLRMTLVNSGSEGVWSVGAQSALDETYLVDSAQQKKYEVIRESGFAGKHLSSQIYLNPNLKPGARMDVWAQFPSSPSPTMHVHFRDAAPIMNVPVTP